MRRKNDEPMCNEACEFIVGLVEEGFTCEVCLAEDIDCLPIGTDRDYIFACYYCVEDALHAYGYRRAERDWAATHPPELPAPPPTLWERIKGLFR